MRNHAQAHFEELCEMSGNEVVRNLLHAAHWPGEFHETWRNHPSQNPKGCDKNMGGLPELPLDESEA